jgi:hypothetical protein
VELFEADAGSINFSCGYVDEVDLAMILFFCLLRLLPEEFLPIFGPTSEGRKSRAQVEGRGHMTTYILLTSLQSGRCLMKYNYSNNNRFQLAL